MRKTAELLQALTLSALFFGCQGPEPTQPLPIQRKVLPEREVFVAMERDFQGFRSWGSALLNVDEAQGVTHQQGQRRVYINAFPPLLTALFPTGTMIVKEAQADAEGRVRLFGMVKRGAGFNAGGALGWEWFELKERDDKSVGIAWRGLGAPDGEVYGGDPSGTCNTCHQQSAKGDFVQSRALQLVPDKG
jgi:hypothetical protein